MLIFFEELEEMARFYGTVSGSGKTLSTKTGSAKTGLTVKCRGWNVGVSAQTFIDCTGKDGIDIYVDSGSSEASAPIRIGTVFEAENGGEPIFVPNLDMRRLQK